VTLTSGLLGLLGRPDRLINADSTIIVGERKSSRRGWPFHVAQMGGYFLLIDVRYGLR
jgi:CRISPR-associated exonuclease Cas4